MLIPFDFELAKMVVEAETGVIETANGDPVEILKWNDNGYIYGKIYSWTGGSLFFHWDTNGDVSSSICDWRNYNLVIKPTIPL